MTVQEFQARKFERIAKTVAHFVATTPEDKLDWRPSVDENSCTRSTLDQISECIACNRMIASIICGEQAEMGDDVPITDAQTAQAELIASARELAAVVRAMPDEALSKTFSMSRASMTGEVLIDLAHRNMAYHGGQINFIQLLLGDKEFHQHPDAFR